MKAKRKVLSTSLQSSWKDIKLLHTWYYMYIFGSLFVAKKKFIFFHKRNITKILCNFLVRTQIWFDFSIFFFFFCPQKVETWPIIHKPHLFKNPNLTIILRHIFILMSSNLYVLLTKLRTFTHFLRQIFSNFFESWHTFCVKTFLISLNLYILFALYTFWLLQIFTYFLRHIFSDFFESLEKHTV